MKASIVIKNGHLMTMDEAVSNAEWIALRGEQILAVGCGADYLHYTDRNTRIIDAAGKTVLPGFIDSHFHVAITALGESRISLEGVRNFSEAGQRLKEAAGSLNGKALIATGLDCDKLEEGRFPDRTFLDRYCADIPAAVYSADYHALILNTCGILYFKAPFTLNGIDIDGKGMPTGIFTNQAGAKLDANIFRSASEKEMDAAVRKMIPGLFARGLTTVVAMEGGNMNFDFDENRECEFLYENRRRYPLDMELFYQTTNTDIVEKKNLRRIGGALYVDGTLGRHTAALSRDYADAPGKRGLFCIDSDTLQAFVSRFFEKNLQVALDAIGDAAIETALYAFEQGMLLHGKKDRRCRIEHGEMMTEAQMERAAELGVVLSVQPAYEGLWGGPDGMYRRRLGQGYMHTNQLREMIDAGLVVCGGSDSDVTEPAPLLGIHYAVNHPVEKHRISLEEAVAMYTKNGAYGLFLEDKTGTLTAGKLADVVILEKNIKEIGTEQLKDVKVSMTIKRGQIVYDGGFYAET